MPETIIVDIQDSVAVIRLNRPGQLNALNSSLARDLIGCVERFASEGTIGAVVITGSDKAFAAGADIAEMADKTADQMHETDFLAGWERFAACPLPKIAAVNGYALGGGCELMMMCDFAIAGEGARFGQPEIKLGIIAGMGGTQRMTRLIGRARAMDMHLTGRTMTAPEALQAGLVARVVADEQVLPTAIDAARTIASYSRHAVRAARDAIMQAEQTTLAAGILHERTAFRSLFGTPDQKEGMAAFIEKRAPRFGGNA